jgi:hypothetical protein
MVATTTVLSGLAATAPAQAAEKIHVDLGTLLEAAPPCASEPILWTGGYDMTVSVKKASKGTTVRLVPYASDMTGTGTKSGRQYKMRTAYFDVSATRDEGSTFTFMPQSYSRTGGGASYRSSSVSVTIDSENDSLQVQTSNAGCKS